MFVAWGIWCFIVDVSSISPSSEYNTEDAPVSTEKRNIFLCN